MLVLDLDAHCGGGTRSMTDPAAVVQIDVSTIRFDRWSPSGHDSLVFADSDDYLDRVTDALAMADRVGPFDLVLYNAGMDPSDSGVSESQLGQREQMVAEWAGGARPPARLFPGRWVHRWHDYGPAGRTAPVDGEGVWVIGSDVYAGPWPCCGAKRFLHSAKSKVQPAESDPASAAAAVVLPTSRWACPLASLLLEVHSGRSPSPDRIY